MKCRFAPQRLSWAATLVIVADVVQEANGVEGDESMEEMDAASESIARRAFETQLENLY